jgi:hypothetical protein
MQDRLREIQDQQNERLRAGRDALADLETQHNKERASRITAFQQQIWRVNQGGPFASLASSRTGRARTPCASRILSSSWG